MPVLTTRAALLALGFAATPALALPDPFQPTPPFAIASASFSDSGTHFMQRNYGFQFGAGATNAYSIDKVPGSPPPSYTQTVYSTASVTYAGYPYVSLTATNPTDPSGAASAHGELSYQYLVSIPLANINGSFTIGDAYSGVSLIHAVSTIHSQGLITSLSITSTAQLSAAQFQAGVNVTGAGGDGSGAGVVYDNVRTYDIAGAGQYVGEVTVGGQQYGDFIGTIRLYADVYGQTTSHQMISDGITPPGWPAGVPYTVTVNALPGKSGSLSVDPLITVNPAFLHQYNLAGGNVTLSPGVANASAPVSGTPEPAAWALLIAGFGLTGAMQRRRRAVAA